MITVFLIDDHTLFREGLRSLLERNPDVQVVGEAGDGRSGVALVTQTRPDIAVIDIGMPELNGIDAARQIREQSPRTRVLALSMHHDRRYVLAMLDAGAAGYIAKDSAANDLLRAVQAIAAGRSYVDPEVAHVVVHGATTPTTTTVAAVTDRLTKREREVLQLLAEGWTSAEIAGEMHISPATVDTHRRNVMRKTQLRNVADLTRLAIREGLISMD